MQIQFQIQLKLALPVLAANLPIVMRGDEKDSLTRHRPDKTSLNQTRQNQTQTRQNHPISDQTEQNPTRLD